MRGAPRTRPAAPENPLERPIQHSGSLSVYGALELFAGLEFRLLGGWNMDAIARAGIAPFRRFALRNAKGSKTAQAHVIAILERFGDGIEHTFNGVGAIGLGKAGLGREGSYEVVFVHGSLPWISEDCNFVPGTSHLFEMAENLKKTIY